MTTEGAVRLSSTIIYAASASWIAVTAAHVQPKETGYVLAAVISAIVLDVGHIVFVIQDQAIYQRPGYRGHLPYPRSAFPMLLGLLLAGAVSTILFFIDPKLAHVAFIAFSIRIVQDWALGKSHPLMPVDNTEVQLLLLTFKQKVLVDIVVLIVFGGLWTLYLADHL